jgi:hypothetical protein
LGLTGKIGIYGRSLGGVVATHLADKADFIYADRTFSNFEVLANRKFFSPIARYLFKMSSGGWTINNYVNALNKGSYLPLGSGGGTCHKVLITEKADEVVEVHSSLMAGVAREALGRKNLDPGSNFYLSLKQQQQFINAT